MSRAIALIIDDEPDILELLNITLSRMGIDSISAQNLSDAKSLLKTNSFNICLTDLQLPDGSGLELVEHVQQHYPNLPIAVITAFGSMDVAIQALKSGAFDFVSKPVDLKSLKKLVSSAIKTSHHPLKKHKQEQLLGDSVAMTTVRNKITKLARSQAPIYISGESGTGKELVAKLIHQKGPRADQHFVAINCGAIPQELMESEFFGHKKGSFTGAIADKKGLFQRADGGTLFLDEIADLPLHMQVKLLRAIQEKAIRPIGSETEHAIDVRILSATHKNLATLVDKGDFRQDLYYRVNVIELALPALKNRLEDIPTLTAHILNKIKHQQDNSNVQLTAQASEALAQYNFPGNVRELENILERALTLCENSTINEKDLQLPNHFDNTQPPDKPVVTQEATQQNPAPLENYLGSVEKQAIVNALEKTRWNKTAAAKELGITFRALRYRLQKLGLSN